MDKFDRFTRRTRVLALVLLGLSDHKPNLPKNQDLFVETALAQRIELDAKTIAKLEEGARSVLAAVERMELERIHSTAPLPMVYGDADVFGMLDKQEKHNDGWLRPLIL